MFLVVTEATCPLSSSCREEEIAQFFHLLLEFMLMTAEEQDFQGTRPLPGAKTWHLWRLPWAVSCPSGQSLGEGGTREVPQDGSLPSIGTVILFCCSLSACLFRYLKFSLAVYWGWCVSLFFLYAQIMLFW